MAYFKFTKAICEGTPITVFNHGNMERDFTYIDDIIEGVVRVMKKRPDPNTDWDGTHPDAGSSYAPYRIYNIGNNTPVKLMDFIETLENALGKKAQKKFLDMQPGDVRTTFADVEDLVQDIGFKPSTQLEHGIQCFVDWYQAFYGEEVGLDVQANEI